MRFFILFIIGTWMSPINAQKMEATNYEQIIDHFALGAVNNRSFQNGKNVWIKTPKNDTDALKKGFKFAHIDQEQDGGWALLFAKDIIIKGANWLPYRAILYRYQEKNYLVLLQKEEEDKYYFRIFNPIWNTEKTSPLSSQKYEQEHETIIDDFVQSSIHNLSFQNGINTFIETPESDEDILYKGFRTAHTDREYNGSWKILAAKDVIIKDYSWLPYRAILYEYKEKQFIVLCQKEAENKYYFRIFNARYTK